MSTRCRYGLRNRDALVAVLLFITSAANLLCQRQVVAGDDANYPQVLRTSMSLQSHGGWGNVHEKTHGVNSALRNTHGGECFYLLHGRYVKFRRLRTPTIAQVSRNVKMRGGVAWYLTGSPSWEDWPLYLFDELTAYTNGSVETWNTKRSDNHGALQFAMEFQHYTAVMIQLVSNDYPDKRELVKFWLWNYERLKIVERKCKASGFVLYGMNVPQWSKRIDADEKIMRELL